MEVFKIPGCDLGSKRTDNEPLAGLYNSKRSTTKSKEKTEEIKLKKGNIKMKNWVETNHKIRENGPEETNQFFAETNNDLKKLSNRSRLSVSNKKNKKTNKKNELEPKIKKSEKFQIKIIKRRTNPGFNLGWKLQGNCKNKLKIKNGLQKNEKNFKDEILNLKFNEIGPKTNFFDLSNKKNEICRRPQKLIWQMANETNADFDCVLKKNKEIGSNCPGRFNKNIKYQIFRKLKSDENKNNHSLEAKIIKKKIQFDGPFEGDSRATKLASTLTKRDHDSFFQKLNKENLLQNAILETPSSLKKFMCSKCRHLIFRKSRWQKKGLDLPLSKLAKGFFEKDLNLDNKNERKANKNTLKISAFENQNSNLTPSKVDFRFPNLQGAYLLISKFLFEEPISAQDTLISKFEKKMLNEFLKKKKVCKRLKMDILSAEQLSNLQQKASSKRKEEELKYVFKKCLNRLQSDFKSLYLREAKPKRKKILSDLDWDYLFYDKFFGDFSRMYQIPLESFFHFRNWKSRRNDNIPKSITKKYIALLKINPVFIAQFEGYLKGEFVEDAKRSIKIKLENLVYKWEKTLLLDDENDKFSILIKKFKKKKVQLPWRMKEIKRAIKTTVDFISKG